jgi:hypothetical protein
MEKIVFERRLHQRIAASRLLLSSPEFERLFIATRHYRTVVVWQVNFFGIDTRLSTTVPSVLTLSF